MPPCLAPLSSGCPEPVEAVIPPANRAEFPRGVFCLLAGRGSALWGTSGTPGGRRPGRSRPPTAPPPLEASPRRGEGHRNRSRCRRRLPIVAFRMCTHGRSFSDSGVGIVVFAVEKGAVRGSQPVTGIPSSPADALPRPGRGGTAVLRGRGFRLFSSSLSRPRGKIFPVRDAFGCVLNGEIPGQRLQE